MWVFEGKVVKFTFSCMQISFSLFTFETNSNLWCYFAPCEKSWTGDQFSVVKKEKPAHVFSITQMFYYVHV